MLSWVLVTGICLLAAQAIKRENLRVYESFAKSYSRIIAENVNGDMARKYLETNTMDDYYLEVHETMQESWIDSQICMDLPFSFS